MNDTSLKAKIRNIAKDKKISAQAVLQNYLMTRFLYRLSLTEYSDKFVVKGGMLIASLIGIEHRATMDIDTTLKNLPLNEASILQAFEKICSIQTDDNILFSCYSISPIRDDDEYGGYRVSFSAAFGKVNAPISMDVSTGDIITPGAIKHTFRDMFDKDRYFSLWSYPIETVLAEKTETILSRGIDNTRPRDFYDVYMLSGIDYDHHLFYEAFKATAVHRGSFDKIYEYEKIIFSIAESPDMNKRWNEYVRQMPYAKDISFTDTLNAISRLLRPPE